MTKAELRDEIRRKKRAMTEREIEEKSQILANKFLQTETYRRAKTVYGYMSVNQEVRTRPILEQARKDGKRIAIPKCIGPDMYFYYLEDPKRVATGRFSLPTPLDDALPADDETALVLLPGLAFDPDGHRLGYGGGFYDRFLSREPNHPTAALCFDFQLLDHLQPEEHDIAADLVLWA